MENRLVSLLHSSSLHLRHLKQIQALITTHHHNLTPLFLDSLSNISRINYAYQLFDEIPQPTPFFTNSIISVLSKLSLPDSVLRTFSLAHCKGVPVLHYSIAPVLKACTALCAQIEGKQIHSFVMCRGLYSNVFIQSALIDFYCKSADLDSAKMVFDEIIIKEPVPYNCLISGYSKHGNVSAARQIFDEMPCRTEASWNTMITGYAHHGDVSEALRLFEQMQAERFQPNERTLVTVLSVCAKIQDLDMGMRAKKMIDVHPSRGELIVRTAVLEMFAKCGSVDEARHEFDEMERRDVVAWSAMIAGYAQNGRSNEALELFEKMRLDGCKPNEVTLVSVLSACGQLGAVEFGERIGSYIESLGLASGVHVGSALIDMYAKSGNIKRARCIFDEMNQKDLVSWNSMIGGLATNGFTDDVIGLYQKMIEEQLKPNEVTFVGLLTTCTHAGLVDEGVEFFNSMKQDHGIEPRVEHCSCVVDLYCKAGRLDDAYRFVCEMEVEPNVVVWSILLSACRAHSNVELAERLVKKLLTLDPDNSAHYVLLSSLYAQLGKWEEARQVRILMQKKNIQKLRAYSWIELDGTVHKFLIDDKSHPRSDEIHNVVDELLLHLRWDGVLPDFDLQFDVS